MMWIPEGIPIIDTPITIINAINDSINQTHIGDTTFRDPILHCTMETLSRPR